MCTLIVGVDVVGPRTLVAGANRDEDPARPSRTPSVMRQSPRVVGGSDAIAGGTWLAVRGASAAVAVLNRRPRPGLPASPGPTRSRGLLALDVASAVATPTSGLGDAALATLEARLAADVYAPFALAWLSADVAWVAWHDPGAPLARRRLEPGWHVLTHADLNDTSEPRTRRLVARVDGFAPTTVADAEAALLEWLALHDEPGDGELGRQPPACLHEGRMVTVSSAIVTFAPEHATYRHVEGRPCTDPATDYTPLLEAP